MTTSISSEVKKLWMDKIKHKKKHKTKKNKSRNLLKLIDLAPPTNMQILMKYEFVEI